MIISSERAALVIYYYFEILSYVWRSAILLLQPGHFVDILGLERNKERVSTYQRWCRKKKKKENRMPKSDYSAHVHYYCD